MSSNFKNHIVNIEDNFLDNLPTIKISVFSMQKTPLFQGERGVRIILTFLSTPEFQRAGISTFPPYVAVAVVSTGLSLHHS